MKQVIVPLMIFVSGGFMATAWLAHLRVRHYGFWFALAMSWAIVLPEYVLNVARPGTATERSRARRWPRCTSPRGSCA